MWRRIFEQGPYGEPQIPDELSGRATAREGRANEIQVVKARLNFRRGSQAATHLRDVSARYSENPAGLRLEGGYATIRCICNVKSESELSTIDSSGPFDLDPRGWLIGVQTPRASLDA